MSATSDGKDFATDITADPSKFVKGVNDAASAAAGASDQINAQFKKIGESVSSVNTYLMGFVGVLAGGGALKKFISDANEWNGTAGKMASQLGISTQQASVLNVALTRLGIDSETYTGASVKLSKAIQTNGDAFKVLGVGVRDTAGAYRPVTEVMADVNAKLVAIKNPVEQNIAAMQFYGKSWTEVRSILKLTADQLKISEQRARDLGLIVGPEGVAMSKQYSMQMKDLGLVGKSLEVQFGNALLPVFTKIGSFMSQEGPAAGQAFARIIETVSFAAMSAWLALKDMGDGIGAIAAQGAALLSGDLAGFKAIGRMRDEESAKNTAAYEKLKSQFMQPLTVAPLPAGPDLSNGPKYHFKEKGEKEDKGRTPAWEAALAEKKAAIIAEGLAEDQLREMSKAAEAKYWQDIAALPDKTENETIAVAKKSAEAQIANVRNVFEVRVSALQTELAEYKSNTTAKLALEQQIQSKYQAGTTQYEAAAKAITETRRQAIEQQKQIADLQIQATRDAATQTIAIEEQAAQTSATLGTITQTQLLQKQQQFEDRRTAIARDAIVARLADAAKAKDYNPVEVEKLNRELESLEQQHVLRTSQIRNALTVESNKYAADFFSSANSNIATSLESILNGTAKTGTAVRALFTSMGQSLTSTIAKMASDWIIGQIKMRIASKETSLAQLNSSAVSAAGGAYSAVVGIPFVGPVLAPLAAAAAYAGVMAFGAEASAEGGYDIPASVNPIVQTHAREMILPAKHADVIRNMADSGGGRVQAPAQPPFVLPGKTYGNMFMANVDDLAAALKYMNRNGYSK